MAESTTPKVPYFQEVGAQLAALKEAVKAGTLSITDFYSQAEPLVLTAVQKLNNGSPDYQNKRAAGDDFNAAFRTPGFVDGTGKFVMPFSQQEYARLPESVMPTEDDVRKGLFNPALAPIQRYAPTPTPAVNPGPDGTIPPTTQPTGGAALPQVNPVLPTTIDTRTDRGEAALQGQQNAATLQDTLNKQYDTNKQAVSELAQGLSGVPDIYRQEGQNQQNQLNALADSQKTARAQGLTEMASILATNQQNLFNRAIPNLAEQANTKGMYLSTGFGDSLSREYSNLTADTQTQLAQRGLADRDTYLSDQANALTNGLNWSGQGATAQANNQSNIAGANAAALQSYGSGLGDVANAAIGSQNAGLQRQFSLADFITQQQAAQKLADSMKTQGPSGKSQTQQAVQTGLMGVNTATSAYGAAKGKPGA